MDDPWDEATMAYRREVSGEGLEAQGEGPDDSGYIPFTNDETEKAWLDYDPKAQAAVCPHCGQPMPAS